MVVEVIQAEMVRVNGAMALGQVAEVLTIQALILQTPQVYGKPMVRWLLQKIRNLLIIKPRPVAGFFICGGGSKFYLTMKIIMDMKDI